MTTSKIAYTNEFFHFDPEKVATNKRKIFNPRTNTSLRISVLEDSKAKGHYILTSKYDLEIYPMTDPADVFCNIKTIMVWDFELEKNQEFSTNVFAESLLHHILNQIHFATLLLRQHFSYDYATLAGLLPKLNPEMIYKKIKETFKSLPDLKVTKVYPFIFSYWY